VRDAKPELESLVAALGLRARLSVRDGYRAILLRASSNDASLGSFVAPGRVTPVWCTGAGRALLWDHDQPALDQLLHEVNFIGVGGPGAAHSTAEVRELMARDVARGHITCDEEFEHDILELAVPVRVGDGSILAALSVLGRRADVGDDAAGVAAVLRGAADRLGSSAA
jgi:DNA-binding IclR family transcriptional regulator